MIETAINAFLVFLFAFSTGLGLHELVVPHFLRRVYLFPWLCVGLGLLQVSFVDTYLIAYLHPVSEGVGICVTIGLATLAIAAAVHRRRYRKFFTTFDMRAYALTPRRAMFVALLLIVLAPMLRTGMSTTPWRIGIDQVGYGEVGQFLVEGGTTASALTTLVDEVKAPDQKTALQHNNLDVSFNSYVDTEFLLKALRWGFPATIASLTLLTQNAHVFRVEFLVVIFSYALGSALAYYMLREFLQLGKAASFGIMSALMLNCNALNVYYEGQLAQIFVAPYFITLFILFAHARTWLVGSREPYTLSAEFLRTCAFFGLSLAALFANYNEAIVLLVGSLYGAFALDVLLKARSLRRVIVMLTCGIALGFVLMLPLSVRWVSYTFANLANIGNTGFSQPYWASLGDILGFLDMYLRPGYAIQYRTPDNEWLMLTISLIAGAVTLAYVVFAKKLDRAFWLTPSFIVAAVYWKVRFHDKLINYSYFKVYTMLLPFIVCLCFAALWFVLGRRKWTVGVFYAAVAAASLNGLLYINRYMAQEHWVTADMFAMYTAGGKRNLADYDMLTPHTGVSDFMLVPIVQMNWLNESHLSKVIADRLARPVVVLLRNEDLTCRTCFVAKYQDQILFENPSYIAFDPRMSVGQLCPRDQVVDIRRPQPPPDVFPPQCAFSYPATLMWVIK